MKRKEHNRLRALALSGALLGAGLLAACSGKTTEAFPDGSYPIECVTPTAPCPPGGE